MVLIGIQLICSFRRFTSACQGKEAVSDNAHLVKFILHVIVCSHSAFVCAYNSAANQRNMVRPGKRLPRYASVWDVQTLLYTMLGDAFTEANSSFTVDIWQSTIEVCLLIYFMINMMEFDQVVIMCVCVSFALCIRFFGK